MYTNRVGLLTQIFIAYLRYRSSCWHIVTIYFSYFLPGFLVRTIFTNWDIHPCSIALRDRWLLFVPFPTPGWMIVDQQRRRANTHRLRGICTPLLQFLCWSVDGWDSSAALHVTWNLFLPPRPPAPNTFELRVRRTWLWWDRLYATASV